MNFLTEKSPHIRRKDSLFRMLLDVCIALFPVEAMAIVVYGWNAVRNILISVFVMAAAEFVCVLIRNRIPYDGTKHTFKEHFLHGVKAYSIPANLMAPIVSGAIFALIMPPSSDPLPIIYIALITGALVGIILGKLVFGGTGQNIFNPAAVGMVFAKVCFGSKFSYVSSWYFPEGVYTGGTLLTGLDSIHVAGMSDFVGKYAEIGNTSILDMFLGRMPGVIGEAFSFMILLGLVYLLVRRALDWRVEASFFGTFLVLMSLAGLIVSTRIDVNFFQFMGFELLSGGLLFGAVYMLSDPVTMPITSPGRVMYGMIAACITVFIRLFGALPEGMVYAILISNMLAPVIDRPRWASQRYTWKKILALGIIGSTALLLVGLGMGFGGKVA